MSFGDRLRSARESRGYTQQQIADRMGIDKSTYCGYETGKRQPDVQKIKQLSRILGVSGDDLLETDFADASHFADDSLTKENRNVIKIAGRDGSYRERHLTDEQLAAFNAMLDALPEAPDDL